jgi:hypothetical protein
MKLGGCVCEGGEERREMVEVVKVLWRIKRWKPL